MMVRSFHHQNATHQPQQLPGQQSLVRANASPAPTGQQNAGVKDVSQLLTKASELEDKLSQPPSSNARSGAATSDDSILQGYRLRLCEALSDVLLTNPSVACQNDAAGRLWRNCFYGRICDLRNRASKEAARIRKNPSISPDRKEGLERNLQQFLREAVVLYDFLIQKYELMMKRERQQHQQSKRWDRQLQSRDATSCLDEGAKLLDATPSLSEPGAVAIMLHQLLIHRGDLHRYSNDYARAETSYQQSARLLPGRGNPYNQLAVVCQHRDQTCVALYYYSRSLGASDEPFRTSRGNLRRLFGANSLWFDVNKGKSDAYGHILERQLRNSGACSSAGGVGVRLAKSGEKGAVVKLFLSAYAEVHSSFMNPSRDEAHANALSGNGSEAEKSTEFLDKDEALASSIESVICQFRLLLMEQCLSDALVIKMVVVNVFAFVSCTEYAVAPGLSDEDVLAATRLAASAMKLAYRFGVILIEQVERHAFATLKTKTDGVADEDGNGGDVGTRGSTKRHRSCGNGGGSGSLRQLAPLVLFCDWLRCAGPPATDDAAGASSAAAETDPATSALRGSRDEFYSKLASLWNALRETNETAASLHRGDVDSADGLKVELQPDGGNLKLKEHCSLRGFGPFLSFIEQVDESRWKNAFGEVEARIRLRRLFLCVTSACCFDSEQDRFVFRGSSSVDTVQQQCDDVSTGTQDEEAVGGTATTAEDVMEETQPKSNDEANGFCESGVCGSGRKGPFGLDLGGRGTCDGNILQQGLGDIIPATAAASASAPANAAEDDADDVIVYRAPAVSHGVGGSGGSHNGVAVSMNINTNGADAVTTPSSAEAEQASIQPSSSVHALPTPALALGVEVGTGHNRSANRDKDPVETSAMEIEAEADAVPAVASSLRSSLPPSFVQPPPRPPSTGSVASLASTASAGSGRPPPGFDFNTCNNAHNGDGALGSPVAAAAVHPVSMGISVSNSPTAALQQPPFRRPPPGFADFGTTTETSTVTAGTVVGDGNGGGFFPSTNNPFAYCGAPAAAPPAVVGIGVGCGPTPAAAVGAWHQQQQRQIHPTSASSSLSLSPSSLFPPPTQQQQLQHGGDSAVILPSYDLSSLLFDHGENDADGMVMSSSVKDDGSEGDATQDSASVAAVRPAAIGPNVSRLDVWGKRRGSGGSGRMSPPTNPTDTRLALTSSGGAVAGWPFFSSVGETGGSALERARGKGVGAGDDTGGNNVSIAASGASRVGTPSYPKKVTLVGTTTAASAAVTRNPFFT